MGGVRSRASGSADPTQVGAMLYALAALFTLALVLSAHLLRRGFAPPAPEPFARFVGPGGASRILDPDALEAMLAPYRREAAVGSLRLAEIRGLTTADAATLREIDALARRLMQLSDELLETYAGLRGEAAARAAMALINKLDAVGFDLAEREIDLRFPDGEPSVDPGEEPRSVLLIPRRAAASAPGCPGPSRPGARRG